MIAEVVRSPLVVLETPDLLRGWMESLLPNDVVGACGLPDQCVIADFLKVEGFGPYVSVGKFDVMVGTDETDLRQYMLPDRAKALIGCIDAYGLGTFITAEKTLAILGEIWTHA